MIFDTLAKFLCALSPPSLRYLLLWKVLIGHSAYM